MKAIDTSKLLGFRIASGAASSAKVGGKFGGKAIKEA